MVGGGTGRQLGRLWRVPVPGGNRMRAAARGRKFGRLREATRAIAGATALVAWLVFLIALSAAVGNAIEGPWRGSVAPFDHAVAMWVHSLSCPAMDGCMGLVSWIGEPAPMAAVTGGIFLYLVLRSRWASAMSAVLTMPGTAVMWLATSWLVERPRPEYWVSHPGADPGYPGGHVMNAIVIAGVCLAASLPRARQRWQRTGLVIFWLGFVGAMALCRVYWCIHFPSDQIAGSLMGFAWVGLALPVHRWTFPGLRDFR